MDSTSPVARFTINTTREVFIFGDEHYISMLQAQTKGYYFLNPRPGADYGGFRQEMHFVIAVVDFNNTIKTQQVSRLFSAITSSHAHKLLYVAAPADLGQEHLLFARELGIRFVFSGKTKNDELKEYLKRVCIESSEVGSVTDLEEDIERARIGSNKLQLQKIIDKIRSLPRETEDSLRLLVLAYGELHDYKRTESCLRRLLGINPQNLWAANSLAKLYLRSGRAALGIEMMQKLSQFHELNSDRHLVLGKALLVAGDDKGAELEFEKGAKLSGGADQRFSDGMAVVKVVQGDAKGALTFLGDKVLSGEVLSFLNLRAIMASRQGKYQESVRYYEFALNGSGVQAEISAKLKFNMALAFVRMNDLVKASKLFSESLQLGGKKFQRARRPLEIVISMLAKKSSLTEESRQEILSEAENQWETLF